MRGLLVLVIAMGVLIVAGVATIAVTILHRMTTAAIIHPAPVSAVLDQPAGTQIVAASAEGGRMALVLRGGGPDRVVILDAGTGLQVGEVRLAR